MPFAVSIRSSLATFVLCLAFAAHANGRLPQQASNAFASAGVPESAVGVVVQEVGRSRPRLAVNPTLPLNPASLFKLVTTAAALDLLGTAYTWSTPVWFGGPVIDPGPNGVLDGPLAIKGSGDPKLVIERLWLLLRRIRAHGIAEIRGDIVLDRSAFEVPEGSPADFDSEPSRPYNVRPDALLLNHKALLITFTPDVGAAVARISAEPGLAGVRIAASVPLNDGPCDDWRAALKAELADPERLHFAGSYPLSCGERAWPVAYADPHSYNARLVQALWREVGGRLKGSVRDGTAPTALKPALVAVSPPLAEVVRDINKFSNNAMAQQLFLTLGLVQRGRGTPEAARETVRQWMGERFGADAASAVVDNGSGLSRDTRVSAMLLARLLQWVWASPAMPELIASLPVAGIDGTMIRSRAPYGRAHLKTGSLRDVAGVAGIVHGLSGRRYVLVAIVNHPGANGREVRAAFDALVQWAAEDR